MTNGLAGSFGGLAASNAQEKKNLAEAITISQKAEQGHTSGFEVNCTGFLSSTLKDSM